MKTLANKITVPEAGDDILGSLESQALDSTAAIPVASIAEAELVAAQVKAAGRPITAARPVIFLINRVNLYIYDGDLLRPANEILLNKAAKTGSGRWKTLKPSTGDLTILTCAIPAKPYDRVVDATAILNIDIGRGDENVAGWVKAFIDINGANYTTTRLDESTMEGSTMIGRAVVKAGVAPIVKLQFRAYGANMKYYISTASSTTIYAETRPIKMDIEESYVDD